MKLPNLPISLSIINIENNIFNSFPFSVLQPLNLEELYTANNQIYQFPIQLFNMQHLKKFSSEWILYLIIKSTNFRSNLIKDKSLKKVFGAISA